MNENDKIWNEAIDTLANKLYRYFWNYKGTPNACAVAYHVKQIAKDLKRGETDGKN